MNGNKFKANTVVAIKLARAVFFMLKNKTVFDLTAWSPRWPKTNFSPGSSPPRGLTGTDKQQCPDESQIFILAL
jgi:hypothetical protein